MPVLEWIGKSKVVNHHLDVPYHVLEKKYTFDAAGVHAEGGADDGNMIIHGDNLVALKSLLPQYEGRVDCIYIDPPYNTGNENWVYNDNVNDPRIRAWLGKVVGKEGEDLSRHDKWLCMMYPRLKLLRQLLADDGAIFISIDDNEQTNLQAVCDEIFGESNRITTFIWRKVDSPNDNKVPVTPDHEYILAYAKNLASLHLAQKSAPEIVKAYGQVDEDGRRYRDRLLKKNGRNSLRIDRPTMYFPLIAPDGTEVYPMHDNGEEARWAMGRAGIERNERAGTLIWKQRKRGDVLVWEPYTREFAPDNPTRPYPSIWYDLPTMRQAKALMRDIFGNTVFDTPKPHELIEQILRMMNKKHAIVLDSFAGSGTTAHAVLDMNAKDGGHRRFLLIELGDYAESITAERVKRVIRGYGEGKRKAKGTGGTFGFYELGPVLMEQGRINEAVDVEELRRFVFFTETRQGLPPVSPEEPYLLGTYLEQAYYFYYEREQTTWLNESFLSTMKTRAARYVIYADGCSLSADELAARHITFKKIPRDIVRV